MLSHLRNFYARFERPISSLSLIGGFVFDILTLHRVDEFWENFWIAGHLFIAALCIILINKNENSGRDEEDPKKPHFWYVNVLQFFFGGLLSTYLVFYFRSADIGSSWPFLLLLALAFWANESWKRRFARMTFQISLFYLSLFAFFIYTVPIILHKIGQNIFLISGALSLFAIILFLVLLRKISGERYIKKRPIIFSIILVIYFLITGLYFANLIPPLPLSLKDAGIYHSISKTLDGNYLVESEDLGWKKYFTFYPEVNIKADDFLVAYSAIFSPEKLNTTVLHTWQYYDDTAKSWQTESTINLKVSGGRDGGYRTYSIYGGLVPGLWRVLVTTPDGLTIGVIKFKTVRTDDLPKMIDKII